VVPMKYSLWLAIMFAFCPTLVSEQVFEHHETVAESATASSFEQKLDRRVKRFDTAGRTLVASIVDLAFTYQLPTAIENADREALAQRWRYLARLRTASGLQISTGRIQWSAQIA